jgi:N-acetylmuramoyl-L-alanine amidase
MIAALWCLAFAGGEVPLDEILEREGLTVQVDPATGVRSVAGVRFAPGLAVAIVDGRRIPLASPVRVERGRVWLPADLASRLTSNRAPPPPAAAPPPAPDPARPIASLKPGFRVCIDPGHGGSFNGCQGASGRVHEKTLALSISLELADLLRAAGAEVVLTRSEDRHLSDNYYKDLQGRVDAADRCDAFVSIHLNWSAQREVRGFEVYVSRSGPHRERSGALARRIQAQLRANAGTIDRGVKEAGFYVLKNAPCPAALVELEFISNPEGERDMMSPGHRARVARAVADAIVEYAKSRGH